MLRTSSGIGVVVLTNFGATNTLAFANRALDVLAATGAMKPREPSLPNPSTYTPVMTAFLDVYNKFDRDKLVSILARPLDPREPDELAGYKALHGNCTAFKLTKVGQNNALEFAMTCEHGPFELEVNLSGDKLGGFTGRSPGVAPPDKIKKLIAAAIALHLDPVWSESNYKLLFPKQLISEAMSRTASTQLRSEFGTCKQRAVTSDGTGWSVELDCSKGPLTLSIHLDAHDVIEGIGFHPPQGTETRCPTR